MKITLTNIKYSESYKALVVHATPSELAVEIPDNTRECDVQNAVFLSVAKQWSPAMAEAIESAEFQV